jgi:cation:H+ antiporter
MEQYLPFIIFIVSLIGLILSGDWLVDGASGVAYNFKMSKGVVGLTIVAAGTSMPELVVSLFSAVDGNPDIAVGNVVGSNMFNIGMILALTALIYPIVIHHKAIQFEWPFMFLTAYIFHLLAKDGELDRLDSSFLLFSFVAFVFYMVRESRRSFKDELPDNVEPASKSIFLLVIGVLGLIVSGKFLVSSAVDLAHMVGMSERVIGLTVVSAGTSMPELVASIIAARKKESEIALGNVIGSNIFNILLILGAVGTIMPIHVSETIINYDNWWMLGFSLILFPLLITGKKITRGEGLMLFVFFIIYFVTLFLK